MPYGSYGTALPDIDIRYWFELMNVRFQWFKENIRNSFES